MLVALFRVAYRIGVLARIPSMVAKVRQARWKAQLRYMGEGSLVYRNVVIHSAQRVSIGARVAIAEFVHIWGGGEVSIGNDVLIASHVVITSQSHDLTSAFYRDTVVRQPVTIKDNVWIGSGAVVLPGVTIGGGAVIGAGCVVTKDVPDYALVVGVPGRVVRTLRSGGSRRGAL